MPFRIYIGYFRRSPPTAGLKRKFRLGLLGFIEPCSIGANGIFLGYLRQKDRRVKLFETVKFMLVRSAVLGLLKRLSPERLLSGHKDYSSRLGLLFGLNLPVCALMLALLGRSTASGASWGFAALFVFGLALSAPLVPLALSGRAAKLFERLGRLGAQRRTWWERY